MGNRVPQNLVYDGSRMTIKKNRTYDKSAEKLIKSPIRGVYSWAVFEFDQEPLAIYSVESDFGIGDEWGSVSRTLRGHFSEIAIGANGNYRNFVDIIKDFRKSDKWYLWPGYILIIRALFVFQSSIASLVVLPCGCGDYCRSCLNRLCISMDDTITPIVNEPWCQTFINSRLYKWVIYPIMFIVLGSIYVAAAYVFGCVCYGLLAGFLAVYIVSFILGFTIDILFCRYVNLKRAVKERFDQEDAKQCATARFDERIVRELKALVEELPITHSELGAQFTFEYANDVGHISEVVTSHDERGIPTDDTIYHIVDRWHIIVRKVEDVAMREGEYMIK